jgi:hypothetical protein
VTRTAMGGLFAGFISGAIVVLFGLGSQPGAAQPPAPGSVIPRTASGKPDLNGLWQALTSANYDIQAHTARPAMAMRPGPVVPLPAKEVLALGAVGAVPSGAGIVDGDELPYLPAALEQRKKNQENWLTLDPEIKCYLPGIPRATYMPFPFQIVQSDSAFFMAYEYAGATRNILPKDPGPPQVDAWMGQAVGRWDGDTFVIESNGFNDQTWFDRAGNFHSEQLTVTERYTMTDRDHIQYEATITDPKVFSRPWTMSFALYRHVNANARLGQFKCVEFVEELMFGHLRKTLAK